MINKLLHEGYRTRRNDPRKDNPGEGTGNPRGEGLAPGEGKEAKGGGTTPVGGAKVGKTHGSLEGKDGQKKSRRRGSTR